MGVDFKGGDQITLEFTAKKTTEDLRNALGQDSQIQYQAASGGKTERLQVTVGFGKGEQAYTTLTEQFADAEFKKVSQLRTGPSISGEILQGATKSLLIALCSPSLFTSRSATSSRSRWGPSSPSAMTC